MASVRYAQKLTKCAKIYNCCSFLDNTNGKRNFSIGSILRKRSHYDVLGLTVKATQVDIKTAYYELSKLYHPDKNKGSIDAAEKFRDINAAYEILGNFKLRRLYDKGIVHTAGPQYKDVEEATVEVPDDAQTKFYKQRMQRDKAPHASGRTPIYNFDEWNDAHYGRTFARSQAAKKKKQEVDDRVNGETHRVKVEVVILCGMASMTLMFIILFRLA